MTNSDAAELDKFSALANKWWDPNSEFKPLHDINPLRLDFIDHAAHLNEKSVLDVGCGGGILAESMAARGAHVTGIDLAQKSLKIAGLHGLESGVTVNYQCIAVEDMAAQHPAEFDVVTCMEMLEHVPDPLSVVRACATLVKPDGMVFFSTLNRNLKSFLYAIVGAEYIFNILPRGTHTWNKFITPAELMRHARSCGLDSEQLIGMQYDPLRKHYSLGNDASVNYLIACRRNA